jgi:hypothetical protein
MSLIISDSNYQMTGPSGDPGAAEDAPRRVGSVDMEFSAPVVAGSRHGSPATFAESGREGKTDPVGRDDCGERQIDLSDLKMVDPPGAPDPSRSCLASSASPCGRLNSSDPRSSSPGSYDNWTSITHVTGSPATNQWR